MDDQFVTYREAAATTGLTPLTLRRRIAAKGIEVFADPADMRRRRIRRDALAALMDDGEPRLLTPRKGGRAA